MSIFGGGGGENYASAFGSNQLAALTGVNYSSAGYSGGAETQVYQNFVCFGDVAGSSFGFFNGTNVQNLCIPIASCRVQKKSGVAVNTVSGVTFTGNSGFDVVNSKWQNPSLGQAFVGPDLVFTTPLSDVDYIIMSSTNKSDQGSTQPNTMISAKGTTGFSLRNIDENSVSNPDGSFKETALYVQVVVYKLY